MRRAWGVALVAGLLVVLTATGAGAHALVRTSDPADGSIVQKAPPAVVITFTEPPDPSLSFMHVLNSSGTDVERGKSGPVAGKPLEMSVALPSLPNGVYTVTWRAVSRTDGHVTTGSFSFGVGVSPGTSTGKATVSTASTPSPQAVAGRWAFYWGLAIVLGFAAAGIVVSRELPPRARIILGAAWLLAVGGLVAMTIAERSAIGSTFGQLFASHTGHTLIARGVALLVVGVGVGQVALKPRWTSLPPLGLAAAAAMLVHVYAGHADAPSRLRWFHLATQWVHVLAVGIWIGGLVWLVAALRGADVAALRRADGMSRRALVRRFSTMAGIALGLVAVTGVVRALDEVGGVGAWRRLFDTGFGVTLLIKVGLFAGLVVLGARNRYVNVPAIARGEGHVTSLRRTVLAEILVASGVLGVTGVLSGLVPAAYVSAQATAAAAQHVVVVGSDFATTVRVRLTVTPGTVGPNEFQARVTDYDTGRPAPATAVRLQFSLPSRPDLGSPTLPLTGGPGGLWTGQGTALALDGRWNVNVLIQEATGGLEVPLVVQTRLPPEKITVSRAPGQPTLYTIALSGGSSLQTYVDPARPGINQVHFTFFQSNGQELPIASAQATGTAPGGAAGPLNLIRFDAGHFAANATLVAGNWRFQIQATSRDGQVFTAYFDQQIGS